MHPEAEALLNAIYDHPDDDTPRLVYADWLQEHGQENYAQFIRLQCAAAREQLWSAEANRLWEEIGRVWNRLYYEWLPATHVEWPLCAAAISLDAIHFQRGFLSRKVSITTKALAYVERCAGWVPTRTFRLSVSYNEHAATLLAADPVLRRVTECELSGYQWTSTSVVNPLLRSPHFCNVIRLDLSEAYLSTSTVSALLDAPNLASIQQVSVSCWQPNPWHAHGDDPPLDAVLSVTPLRSQLRNRFRDVHIVTE